MDFVSRYSDVFLAAFVVLVVGMMIIPLPTVLLDLLLTLNIAIGITILIVVLYISSAIRLASFPSLLLITTLFRLALNVSTTRLILLKADAGEVIEAFGSFVVQGNIIVGTIVFVILTLVNFIVISKGSERVAEVSARFTLDAMPGKQMAIDADLRAGAFDLQEARSKRRELSRESQLFGAMDGAMKFVKGDAIAGLLITAVNIVGGVTIGVFLRKMDAIEALKIYGLLTIGDGLLSQIPALIMSVAAGLMVTRVDPESKGDHLGNEIASHLLSHPKALFIVSILLAVLGTIPGLPLFPFWSLSVIFGLAALMISDKQGKEESSEALSGFPRRKEGHFGEEGNPLSLPSAVTIFIGRQATLGLNAENQESDFYRISLPQLRQELYFETGVYIPGIRIRGYDDSIPDDSFTVHLLDTPIHRGFLPVDRAFLRESDDEVLLIAGGGEFVRDAFPEDGMLVSVREQKRLEDAGYCVYSGSQLFMYQIRSTLKKHLSDFLGLQEVKWLCEELAKLFPDTVSETIPRMISYQRLSDILRRLVQENVSIRDLKRILEALSEYADTEPDNVALTEKIRIRLGRQIYHQYAKRGPLQVFLLDPSIEAVFKSSIHINGQERFLAFTPEVMEKVVSAFKTHFIRGSGLPSIILTVEQSIRYVIWRFLAQQIQGVNVLAAQEMPPGAQLIALGRIVFSE